MTVRNREYVHTLHLWDPGAPIRGEQLPVTVVHAVSFDDEQYAATTVELTSISAGRGDPITAHLRCLAGVVDADLEDKRVLIHDRDILVAAPASTAAADQPVRWYGIDGNLLAGPEGAMWCEVDALVGALATHRGPGPEPTKGLHHPD